jgi:phosphotransferase family enzyme
VRPATAEPTEPETANVERALKKLRAKPAAWRAVTRGGYTGARRWVVTLDDGRTAFVKVATDELTASWIRDEHVVYSVLRGAPFMPEYLGFFDDGERPVLALEDLSDGTWPPPWDRTAVDAVLETLRAVSATPPPVGTPLAADDAREVGGGWEEIARNPAPFLALGLCDGAWLHAHLGSLRAAASEARFHGDAFLHFDVRSDNTCVEDTRTVLVDWNLTCVGNPQLDVVFWLPSLEAEGGPRPEEILPDADPSLVSTCAAFFCDRAGRPPVPNAPRVREIQLVQARTALPWAARALGLPEPEPPR